MLSDMGRFVREVGRPADVGELASSVYIRGGKVVADHAQLIVTLQTMA